MINITNANTAGRFYRFGCFHVGVMTLACRRFGRFADIKIFKRLQFSSCNFIGGSRRCRRFRRLSQLVIGRVNNVFFPVCRSYRETRPQRLQRLQANQSTVFNRSKIERHPRYESRI